MDTKITRMKTESKFNERTPPKRWIDDVKEITSKWLQVDEKVMIDDDDYEF